MDDDDPSTFITITAIVRRATDEDGSGPSAGAIRNYVADGLLAVARDSTGRLLFRLSDAKRVLQIYQARKERHGKTGRRVRSASAE
jgi:predicted site-specific integrase-resolvase